MRILRKSQRLIVLRRLHGLKWENPQKIQAERGELIIHIRLKKTSGLYFRPLDKCSRVQTLNSIEGLLVVLNKQINHAQK